MGYRKFKVSTQTLCRLVGPGAIKVKFMNFVDPPISGKFSAILRTIQFNAIFISIQFNGIFIVTVLIESL